MKDPVGPTPVSPLRLARMIGNPTLYVSLKALDESKIHKRIAYRVSVCYLSSEVRAVG